jgi:hypothetical protein
MPNVSSNPRLVGHSPQVGSVDLSANESVQSAPLGSIVFDEYGSEYRYVQNGEASTAFARGKVAMQEAATDVDTVSSSTDLLSITNSGSTWTAGQFSGFQVYVNDGTGEGQLRYIIGNSADTLFLQLALTTALAVADSDILIFNPFVVNLATASGQTVPMGVAIGAITAGYFGWLQITGVAEVLVGAGVAVANLAVKMGDDTAGQVAVIANGDDLYDVNPFGYALAANTNADKGAPVKIVFAK